MYAAVSVSFLFQTTRHARFTVSLNEQRDEPLHAHRYILSTCHASRPTQYLSLRTAAPEFFKMRRAIC